MFDLQRQVTLRNSTSASAALWEAFKLHQAWRKKASNLTSRIIVVALPALLTWLIFTAASVLVAEVATQSYEQVQVLIKPENCGFLRFDGNVSKDSEAFAAAKRKFRKDTVKARTYAGNWYTNESSGGAELSIFPVSKLPYNFSTSSACPFEKKGRRCISDSFSAITMDTGLLDSHAMFGINAPKSDRVSFRMKVTCSPVAVRDMVKNFTYEATGDEYFRYYLGPTRVTEYTYQYGLHTALDLVGYSLR
jgi:hypothetical protein